MRYISLFIFLFQVQFLVHAQGLALEVEGALTIAGSATASTANGTIRWTGSDLEVIAQDVWRSLTNVGVVYDNEGNVYNTVAVGKQVWMQENLRATKYRDGSPILQEVIDFQWEALTSGAYNLYNNKANNKLPHGHLYNWYAVADTRGICPQGWHVPDEVEMDELIVYVSENTAGGRLKLVGDDYWTNNVGATNASKMSVVGSGFRESQGAYEELGLSSRHWTTSVDANGLALALYVEAAIDYHDLQYDALNQGYSVRCLKD